MEDRRESPLGDDRRGDDRARSRSPAPRARSPIRERADRSPRRDYDDRPRQDRGEGDVNPGNNLYVTNLSMRTRERDLEKLFGEYGKIHKAAIMYDPHTRESRGFAFVSFDNPDHAGAAMTAISGKVELDGKIVTVELAKRGSARTPTPGRYHGPPYRGEGRDRGGIDRYGGDRYRDDRRDDRYGGRGGDRYGGRDDRYDDRRRDDRRDDRRGDRYDRGDRRY